LKKGNRRCRFLRQELVQGVHMPDKISKRQKLKIPEPLRQ